MRLLIFSNVYSKFDGKDTLYHGSGWVDSLINVLIKTKKNDLSLAISFFYPKKNEKRNVDGIDFFPMYRPSRAKNRIKTIIDDWRGALQSEKDLSKMTKVIEDFSPDLIHVFGTESFFSSIQKLTDVPVVVHLQGLLNPYLNAFYPVGQSKYDFTLNWDYWMDSIFGKSIARTELRIKNLAKRETESLKNLRYVTGRTDWDKKVVKFINPGIEYFHVDEVLREPFYIKRYSNLDSNSCLKKIRIVSTISSTMYKGIDVILKTAKVLKDSGRINFEWSVIGLSAGDRLVRHFERSLGIPQDKYHVKFLGIKKPDEFIDSMLSSNVYVHPSYIDNSPNSVCEAQMLGLPVIACNVGGLSSLVRHNKTGFLVPSNGVYEIASLLLEMHTKPEEFIEIGKEGKKEACLRHDRNTIGNKIFSLYSELVSIHRQKIE